MLKYNVAVLGATGAVGCEMVKILAERNFPVNRIKLLASERSAGKEIEFQDEKIIVDLVKPGVFKDVDLALFSAGSKASLEIAPQAVEEGAIVIDNSNAFRMNNDIPLVIPEVNPEDISFHKGIIANPNCSTIQLVMALKPIYDSVGLKRIVVSTYQAVSGTGRKAIAELKRQVEQYLNNDKLDINVYPYQIAFNILPHIDIFLENGYTQEEMKMVRETRKILHDSKIPISVTTARVPVFYGHSESVNIETDKKITTTEVRKILNKMKGVRVLDDPANLVYPYPILSEKDDDILVGRIRKDISLENGINMWVVGNNLRKGAALNAVQIAEKLIGGER